MLEVPPSPSGSKNAPTNSAPPVDVMAVRLAPSLVVTTVVTARVAVNTLRTWLWSVTHSTPPSATMSFGDWNRAAGPTPSVMLREPAVPASVVTSPVATTSLRIVAL